MARLIFLFVMLLSGACATKKASRNEEILTVAMRNQLFNTQGVMQNLFDEKDPMFLSLEKNKCIDNWASEVFSLRKKLRSVKTDKEKFNIFLKLGNCHNYIKDFGQSIYYYNIVLGSKFLTPKISSIINFNLAQMYELSGQGVLAFSLYKESLRLNSKNNLARLKIGILEYQQGEFVASNQHFNKLKTKFPQSEILKFLIGVNYYHMNKLNSLKNKVLNGLDEKSLSSVLLVMARDLSMKNKQKQILVDLKNLDVNYKLHLEFKDHLFNRFGIVK